MMNRDEIDATLVRRLIAAQFPHWADLPVRAVEPGGWDNRTFRLGDDLSVRLPSAEGYAGFLRALQRADATGGPAAGEHSFYRGGDPAYYDAEAREAIVRLGARIDSSRATAIWEEGLAATWTGAPVWFHGDVAAGNLLVRGGRLCAVIDFGTSVVGDPACDLYIAWTFLRGQSRAVFREALGRDDGMWARGRAWTLWKALITLRDGRVEARSTYEGDPRRDLVRLAGQLCSIGCPQIV